jgi:hypothetical protein
LKRQNDAKNQTRARLHNAAGKKTARFLVIRLWMGVHVVENKVNGVADFLVDFKSQRT